MRNVVLCAVLAICTAVPAAAQVSRPRSAPARPSKPRVFITVNAGIQQAPSDLSDRFTFEENLETATVDVEHAFEPGPAFDGGVTVALWKRLGAGIAFSSYSRDGSATVNAQIPHPFFFDQPRDITGEVTGLSRSETAVHLQFVYIFPAPGRMRLLLSAGPSRFTVDQEVVTDVHYGESYPFDTATFQMTSTRSLGASAIGFHAGADLSYMFTRSLGLGGMVRFSRADIDLDAPDSRSISVKAGGVVAGVGVRVVF